MSWVVSRVVSRVVIIYRYLELLCVGIQIFLHARVIVAGTNDQSTKLSVPSEGGPGTLVSPMSTSVASTCFILSK